MTPQTDLATTDRELLVTRIFDAPRALVFRAWTEPERAASWWGPQGFTTLSCRMDVRAGGGFRVSARAPDGTVHCKSGIYREVVVPERLVFTYGWEDAQGGLGHEMLVTVTFAEHGDRTRLTLHQTNFESVAARDAHLAGWTSCLERFAGYLANT
ncbi:MAG TPA: SRPBCC domain-containing protein [Acetobacteraceae bacterium]|nr:SRPBCC domain-containing protein [Acetobacteraceae bacterium]